MLDLGIDPTDIHASDTYGDEDETTDNPDGENER